MLTNISPRPWQPGMPVTLACNSKDGKPTSWGGKVIANGSKLHVMDEDVTYIFDQEDRKWYVWTEESGGGGGGGGEGGQSIAPDVDVDEALDDLFPTPD